MSAHDELEQGIADAGGGHVRVSASLARELVAEYREFERTRTLGGPVTGKRVPIQRFDQWRNESHPALDVRPEGSTETSA